MALPGERLKHHQTQGLTARREGKWEAARVHLLEAARLLSEQAKAARTPVLQQARLDVARRMLELARDCKQASEQKRGAPSPRASLGGAEDGPPAPQAVGDTGLRFDDIAGLDDVKHQLRLKMIYPFRFPDLAKQYGLKPGGGVLLYGPPGTGKTMLAKATAGELDAAFFVISPAEVLSKWVGEAEQNVRMLFEEAGKHERSVIFLDEVEALVPARRDEGSGVMGRVVPQFLQGMQGFTERKNAVLFLAATNVPWQLDPAVLRPGRFDEKIYIPLPDLAAREKLLELYLARRPLADNVDLSALASKLDGYSGADIKHICNVAAQAPFLHAASTGESLAIDFVMIEQAMTDTPKSVRHEQLQRFVAWATEQ